MHLKLVAVILLALTAAVDAQWLKVPMKGIPRLPDGTPNLSAPAPKTADGKTDLTGIWQPTARYIANIASDLKPEEVPFRPWAEALYKQRQETKSKDDPTGHCIP